MFPVRSFLFLFLFFFLFFFFRLPLLCLCWHDHCIHFSFYKTTITPIHSILILFISLLGIDIIDITHIKIKYMDTALMQ